MKVTPRQNEKIESLVKRFKKLCEREGVIKEIKKHEYYEKPSDARRRAKVKRKRQADIDNKENKEKEQPNNRWQKEKPKTKYRN